MRAGAPVRAMKQENMGLQPALCANHFHHNTFPRPEKAIKQGNAAWLAMREHPERLSSQQIRALLFPCFPMERFLFPETARTTHTVTQRSAKAYQTMSGPW